MVLPQHVRQYVEEYAAGIPFAELGKAVTVLSEQYRAHRNTASVPLSPHARTAAYLVSRLPATYAAALDALSIARRRLPDWTPRTVLDLGAGTGAAALAAIEAFGPELTLSLIEPDKELARAGRELLPDAAWHNTDLTRLPAGLPPHDLVIANYTFSELPSTKHLAAAERAWQATAGVLVIVEPGSPAGFSVVREIRETLLKQGARMVAPCPAETACPIPTGDWCHFAARVERSALHRRLKNATLSYEDEKYSYLVLTRLPDPPPLVEARIIRRPTHSPGMIQIDLCRPDGLGTLRVTKKDRDRFRTARKAAWGDPWA
jgi:ribosomal protein RSM22 (predicted rRNA methylase)